MRVTEPRLRRLVALGLTEGQARAYLALLELGPSAIGNIAKASAMPRTYLYSVVRDLHAMGLVDILGEQEHRYAARSLEGFVRSRVEELDAQRKGLETSLPELLTEFAPSPDGRGQGGSTRVFRGRENALRHLGEGIAGARSTLLLACAGGTAARFASAGLDEALARRVEEGVAVQVLAADAEASPRGTNLPCTVMTRRVGQPAPMEVLLVDGAAAVAWVPRPDDARLTGKDDEGIVSSAPALHDLFAAALAGIGASVARPLPERA